MNCQGGLVSPRVRHSSHAAPATAFRALKLGNAGQVAPVDKMIVVLVAIFGVLFLGERLSLLNWGGVALITLGAVLVAL